MSDQRLELILNAAYTCFTRHGVRRTTMDDIAREAGMSRPGVYQHVRNKDDAFRRLVARFLDAAVSDARSAIQAPKPLAERLAGALEVKLGLTTRLVGDSPAHALELLDDNARLSADLVDAYNAAMHALLTGAVADAHPDADALEITALLLAFVHGLELQLGDDPKDLEVPARRLRHGVALLVTGLEHTPTTANTT